MGAVCLVSACGAVQAECDPGAEVAREFVSGYALRQEPAMVHIGRSTLVTESFKQSFSTAAMSRASDTDPVLGTQAVPSAVKVATCDAKSPWVTLAAADGSAFKVTVKVLNTPQGWRVDGAGAVNMPARAVAR